jgi:hypothetical protein
MHKSFEKISHEDCEANTLHNYPYAMVIPSLADLHWLQF